MASVWAASDEPLFEGPSWIAWSPEEDVRSVAIRIEADGLSLAAPAQQGRFVLSLSVNVPQGDVMYGLLLDVAGQESSPGDVLATLGDAFVLRPGGRVAFADAPVVLMFDTVLQDSRCPTDMRCVRAGEVTLQVSATVEDVALTTRLDVPPGGEAETRIGPYTLTVLDLQPPADADAAIRPEQYRLQARLDGDGTTGLAVGSCAERFPGGLSPGEAVAESFVCIDVPASGAALSPGLVAIAGYSAGAFEASIIVELRGSDGAILDAQPVQVDQREIGLFAGTWTVQLRVPADIDAESGTVAAFAISARDGSVDFGAQAPVRFATSDDTPYDQVEVPAPIETVQILVLESFPPQYQVEIVSGLPNSCAEFSRLEVRRVDQSLVAIEVMNLVPVPSAQVACAEIYRTVSHVVPLGSDFESGVTYTVRVNDAERTFAAQ
jgi:hypothetical protein